MPGSSAVPPIADYFHYEDYPQASAEDGPHPLEEPILSAPAGVALDAHFSEDAPIDFC